MEEINVTLILKGNLMWYPEEKKKVHNIRVNKDTKVIDVINKHNVPIEQVAYILNNSKKINVNSVVYEGDQIEIVPIIAGG